MCRLRWVGCCASSGGQTNIVRQGFTGFGNSVLFFSANILLFFKIYFPPKGHWLSPALNRLSSLHRVFEFHLFQIWNTLLWALSFLRRKGMLEGSKGRLEKVQRWFVPYPFIDGLPGSFQGNGWRLFLVGVSASFRKLSLPSHKSKKWSQKKKVTH